MGPLVPAASQHKYTLVLVDYATHYPEAMPLNSMKAKTVVKKLAQIFTSTGFPKQVKTDQAISFMGETLQALWQYIGVQPLVHPFITHKLMVLLKDLSSS